MLKNGEIYFNGNTSIGLNLFLEEYPSVPIANEDFEEITVEGRSGSLYINKGTYPDKKRQASETWRVKSGKFV